MAEIVSNDVVAVVIYANDKADARFDLNYYNSTHMPLVMEHWGPLGLRGYKVSHFTGGLGGNPPPFRIEATLYWDSVDSIKTATASDVAKIVFGDVPNFTDITPQFAMGEVVSGG